MAAAALNHPHIAHIYEIGEAEGVHFIAMEYIDGETLRHRINEGMKLLEILELTSQAASALVAAHGAGIIHRDIKPENIMVRRDGYIKVLDFGLAKLSEPQGTTTDTDAPTKAMINTTAGTVVGTANYMSPEQAKGIRIDARTDLWSLGAVLYEMVTGQVPFRAETSAESISLILQKEPAPLTRFAHDVPPELERIATKALTKDREERYQTAKDMLIDLRNLKRKLEVDAEIERTGSPEQRSAATAKLSGGKAPEPISPGLAPPTLSVENARTKSSAQNVPLSPYRAVAFTAVLLAAVLALGYVYLKRASKTTIDSIAVLPFVNASNDPNTEYLSEGITESLINSLSQLPQLKVMARSTVFRFKQDGADPQFVGKQLGVRAVMIGKVWQQGDNLIVSAELVNVADGTQLWGEQYNRKLSDILKLQNEISREISAELRLRLTGEQQNRLAKRYTDNTQAYLLYTQGRYFWNKRRAEGMQKAREFFNQAIELDPNYALAYAGLADTYLFPPGGSRPETIPIAKAYAEKALAIDDALAEGHASLAFVKFNYEYDWGGAESEFNRAIQLNPNYATAHQFYSAYLMSQGRTEESLGEGKRALDIDPLSPADQLESGRNALLRAPL
jgi:serine/threonine-protein kinase